MTNYSLPKPCSLSFFEILKQHKQDKKRQQELTHFDSLDPLKKLTQKIFNLLRITLTQWDLFKGGVNLHNLANDWASAHYVDDAIATG